MAQMYMYDVRGIQDYIFRTNKIKEIIGASHLVENIIIRLFEEKSKKINGKVITDYSSRDSLKFFEDESIGAEILYYGGGNLLVIYRSEEEGDAISREMRIQLAKDSYSLQLAVAHVDVTDDYQNDYRNLRSAMDVAKANMPLALPVGGFPITLNDPVTGHPFSEIYDNKRVTRETYTKLKSFDEIRYEDKFFDNSFGTGNENSRVAVVHIDGNNMGKRIMEKMANVTDYTTASKVMRSMSEEIDTIFIKNALKKVKDRYKTRKKPFRVIIAAGDDITFICNAEDALINVQTFMDALEKDYKACAGIYITHMKFPFSRAYEYAEQLCSSAKSFSREQDGCYMDYQVNYTGVLNDLDTIRRQQYTYSNNEKMYARPYFMERTGEGKRKSIKELYKYLEMISEETVARSKIKTIREDFYHGKNTIKQELIIINSRLNKKDKLIIDSDDYDVFFDAVDVMDLKWGEKNEWNNRKSQIENHFKE